MRGSVASSDGPAIAVITRVSQEPSPGSAFTSSDCIQKAIPPSYSPSCRGTAANDITSEFAAAVLRVPVARM